MFLAVMARGFGTGGEVGGGGGRGSREEGWVTDGIIARGGRGREWTSCVPITNEQMVEEIMEISLLVTPASDGSAE